MALAGPGREQQQDAGAVVARKRVTLVRIEAKQHPRACVDRLAGGGDLHQSLEHGHPGVLLHLVIAHDLPGVEHDQDCTGFVARVDDERIPRACRRLDLHQVPALHGGKDRLIRPMTLTVDQLSLGQIGTNCYLVRAEPATTAAVVVDPGADAAEIRLSLARSGATCAAILLTHSHFDHFGALAELAEGTGAPVWLPEGELDVFRRPNDFFPGLAIRAFTGDATLLGGGETVEAAGISFQVRHVPGHSPGHISYYADGSLFSGDVLFAGSVGRTDLPFGDWETLVESIRSLVDAYPPETIVYSGHGPPTTLGDELARNPFLAELRA